jgi:transcriptional regulator with XRE-family HTH domain/sRNA-binding regulator protein Hfq
MQQDLWRLRQEKQWTVNELAAQSGVPALSIYEYEQGRAVRSADLPKLAQVLGVRPEEIKTQSAPKPRKARPAGRTAARPASPAPELQPATTTQVQHLVALSIRLGESREHLEEKVGQPLDRLTRVEISRWLTDYAAAIKERKAQIAADPAGAKRWRAHLPEGVDGYELTYLTEQRKAGHPVTFTLFDGQRLTGRILGFGPYSITIRTDSGTETTLQKLAIAYYAVAAGGDEPT